MNQVKSLAVTLLFVLGIIAESQAFVTVAVELDPYVTTKPPACTSSFVKNFESNLTAWVVNATRSISFLSDFKAPGGFHLTYFNNGTRRFRERALTTTTCSKCTSASCSLSCAIGTCSLCSGSRRRTEEISSADFTSEEDVVERRDTTADWGTVGTSVTRAVKPEVIYYASVYSGGCLGDTNLLTVNVTFLSNIPIDTTMNQAIVTAFGAPVAAPANAPTACCSMDFVSCVTYCGTTQTQCKTCGAVDAGWMPNGPPKGTCISRWNNCVNNVTGCCPGLQCIGDQYWKGCFYVPP